MLIKRPSKISFKISFGPNKGDAKNCESVEADMEHGNPYQSEIELLTKELDEIDQKLSESEEGNV